jgi:ParB-like chromosome segregation protein Spo0J
MGEHFVSPVYRVIRVPVEKIQANSYNPNRIPPPEMKLLIRSILEDGYTMPVVCYYIADDDRYEIIDGFHRFLAMKTCPEIAKRESNCLPVSVIDKPLSERMASTIRHNRARGTHNIDLMVDIVARLTEAGWNDDWIMKHIGMDADEILRLKQINGLASLFTPEKFSKSWTSDYTAADAEKIKFEDDENYGSGG